MPSQAVRPRRPAADPTRERILEAALDLFSERSFLGASTRAIAMRAGVPQPLVAYHYGSKLELWRTAVDRLFAELRASQSSVVVGNDVERAKELVRRFVRFSAEHPALHRIITQECKSEGDRLAWLVTKHIRPLYEATVAMLAPLVERGAVRNAPPAHLYYLLTGAGATMFVLAPECRLLSGLEPFSEEEVEIHASAVVSMLFVD